MANIFRHVKREYDATEARDRSGYMDKDKDNKILSRLSG
jgi:hypothetical protein